LIPRSPRLGSPTSLVIYSADTADENYINQVDAKFEKANNVTITLVSYPSASFMQNYDAAIAGHANMNLLIANGQNIAFMQQHGQLVPLTNLVPSSVFRPSLQIFYHNNKLWAYPAGSMNYSGVIYNMKLLAEYHLSPPTTFAQVIADGKVLGPHGYSVLDAPAGTIYLLVMWYMQTLEQASMGKQESLASSTTTTGSPAFTSSVYVKAMNALYELGKAPGVFESGATGVSETASIALFDAGKAAGYYSGNWDLQPAVAGATFPIGLEQFPNYIKGAPSWGAGGPSFTVAIPSASPKSLLPIEEKWIKYYTSPAVDAILVSEEKQPCPIDAAVATPASALTKTTPAYAQFVKQALAKFAPNTFTFLDWIWPAATVTAMQHAIQDVMGGQMAAKAAMASIQAALTPVRS
jgi:raffinose/stachyose/melibiose transport system substrate-binding protein